MLIYLLKTSKDKQRKIRLQTEGIVESQTIFGGETRLEEKILELEGLS